MADVRKWTDDTGRARWQPITGDGRGRWYECGRGALWSEHEGNALRVPSLHRTRWWARFLASRHERHEARTTWNPTDG